MPGSSEGLRGSTARCARSPRHEGASPAAQPGTGRWSEPGLGCRQVRDTGEVHIAGEFQGWATEFQLGTEGT